MQIPRTNAGEDRAHYALRAQVRNREEKATDCVSCASLVFVIPSTATTKVPLLLLLIELVEARGNSKAK